MREGHKDIFTGGCNQGQHKDKADEGAIPGFKWPGDSQHRDRRGGGREGSLQYKSEQKIIRIPDSFCSFRCFKSLAERRRDISHP